ncbi:MAG: hypothetical protein PVJ80_05900 [Gemmatimonadota bacterium]
MRTTAIALLVALAAASGCKNNRGTGPSPAELTGTWEASKIEFTRVSNPSETVDVVPTGGAATLLLGSGGACTFTLAGTGGPDGTFTGTWSSSGDVLTLNVTGPFFSTTWQFDTTLSTDRLTLSGADTEFTFDVAPEAAKFGLELDRL